MAAHVSRPGWPGTPDWWRSGSECLSSRVANWRARPGKPRRGSPDHLTTSCRRYVARRLRSVDFAAGHKSEVVGRVADRDGSPGRPYRGIRVEIPVRLVAEDSLEERVQ